MINRIKKLPITKKIGLEELLKEYDPFCRLEDSMTCIEMNNDSEDFFVAGMKIKFKNKSKFKYKDVILKISFIKVEIIGKEGKRINKKTIWKDI